MRSRTYKFLLKPTNTSSSRSVPRRSGVGFRSRLDRMTDVRRKRRQKAKYAESFIYVRNNVMREFWIRWIISLNACRPYRVCVCERESERECVWLVSIAMVNQFGAYPGFTPPEHSHTIKQPSRPGLFGLSSRFGKMGFIQYGPRFIACCVAAWEKPVENR